MAKTKKVPFVLTRTVNMQLTEYEAARCVQGAIESVLDDCPDKAIWPELKAFRDADGNIDDVVSPMTRQQEQDVLDILYPVDMTSDQFHDLCYVVIGDSDDGPGMSKKTELLLRAYVKQNLTQWMLPVIEDAKAEMESRKRDEQERDADSAKRRLDEAMKIVRAAGFVIASDQSKKAKSKKA